MSESAALLIERCFQEVTSGIIMPAKGTSEYKRRKKNFTKSCELLLEELAAEEKLLKKNSTHRKKDEAEAGEPVSKKKVKIGIDKKKPTKKKSTVKQEKKSTKKKSK
jgi:hypothetical protein